MLPPEQETARRTSSASNLANNTINLACYDSTDGKIHESGPCVTEI